MTDWQPIETAPKDGNAGAGFRGVRNSRYMNFNEIPEFVEIAAKITV